MKLVFETSEVTPKQAGDIQQALQSAGYLAFNKDPFTTDQKEAIENIKVDYDNPGKTKGQRLRGVLFIYWEKDNQGFETFDKFYDHIIEKLIGHYKKKIDELT
jgi:hypothetical protein